MTQGLGKSMSQTFRARVLRLGLLGLISAGLFSACSSVKLEDNQAGAPIEARGGAAGPNQGTHVSTRAIGPGQSGVSGQALGPGAPTAGPLTDEQKQAFDKKIIYFDYDSFTIRPQDQVVVEAHARALIGQKRKAIIQGHTDERGTSEYNLALGQKRAEAVKRALAALGVPDALLEAVSHGKEKLQAEGGSEEAHSKNRRADLVY
jgi:peptidoglycan-associated lipoprotein